MTDFEDERKRMQEKHLDFNSDKVLTTIDEGVTEAKEEIFAQVLSVGEAVEKTFDEAIDSLEEMTDTIEVHKAVADIESKLGLGDTVIGRLAIVSGVITFVAILGGIGYIINQVPS